MFTIPIFHVPPSTATATAMLLLSATTAVLSIRFITKTTDVRKLPADSRYLNIIAQAASIASKA